MSGGWISSHHIFTRYFNMFKLGTWWDEQYEIQFMTYIGSCQANLVNSVSWWVTEGNFLKQPFITSLQHMWFWGTFTHYSTVKIHMFKSVIHGGHHKILWTTIPHTLLNLFTPWAKYFLFSNVFILILKTFDISKLNQDNLKCCILYIT